jgi:putative ABC transport system permease protein
MTRLMRGLLFGVAAVDVATFAAVAGLVVLVAAVACVAPARRAMRVSPILTLRQN